MRGGQQELRWSTLHHTGAVAALTMALKKAAQGGLKKAAQGGLKKAAHRGPLTMALKNKSARSSGLNGVPIKHPRLAAAARRPAATHAAQTARSTRLGSTATFH